MFGAGWFGSINPLGDVEVIYDCDQCDQSFNLQEKLTVHKETRHKKCDWAPTMHNLVKHNEDEYNLVTFVVRVLQT